MNNKSSQSPDHGPLSEADERVIDAMVGEVLKQTPSPPDLSVVILQQLDSLRVSAAGDTPKAGFPISDSKRRIEPKVRSVSPVRRRRWNAWMVYGSAMALAASVLFLVTPLSMFYNQASETITTVEGAKVPPAALAGSVVPSGQKTSVIESNDLAGSKQSNGLPQVARTTPRRGVPMVRQDSSTSVASDVNTGVPNEKIASKSTVTGQAEATLVQFNETMSQYWKNVGVQPSSDLTSDALAARIEQRFGFKPSISGDDSWIRAALVQPEASAALARRLTDRLFRNVPLAEGARDKMVIEATESIANGEGFDRLVASWLGNEQLFDRSVPNRLSQTLAVNFLDVDAACAKCHDSPVDGRLGQHDYWAFASVFAPADKHSLFYELNDGRQKFAEASLPHRWFAESDSKQLKAANVDNAANRSLQKQFAESLIGSRTLARAIANRLWEIGFDAALVPRASLPIVPPRDDSLQKAHTELSDLLVSNHFDVRAAAQVVLSSVAMRRGQSELVESGRWQLADESMIVSEALLVRSFAASPLTGRKVGRDQLFSLMASRIGNAPKGISGTGMVLAQPMIDKVGTPGGDVRLQKPSLEEQLWASWTAEQQLLRDSWLHWIKDNDEQRKHVYYAAGMAPPKDEASYLELLKSPSDDPAVASSAINDRLMWVLMQNR